MIDAGVRVGLGVDGSASNDSSHMLAEARMALLLQRVTKGATALTVDEALELGTLGGARVLGRDDLGAIAPGKAADFIGVDLERVEYAGAACHDPAGSLILCTPPTVDLSVINGRVVVEDGYIPGLDLARLIARQNEIALEMVRKREERGSGGRQRVGRIIGISLVGARHAVPLGYGRYEADTGCLGRSAGVTSPAGDSPDWGTACRAPTQSTRSRSIAACSRCTGDEALSADNPSPCCTDPRGSASLQAVGARLLRLFRRWDSAIHAIARCPYNGSRQRGVKTDCQSACAVSPLQCCADSPDRIPIPADWC